MFARGVLLGVGLRAVALVALGGAFGCSIGSGAVRGWYSDAGSLAGHITRSTGIEAGLRGRQGRRGR